MQTLYSTRANLVIGFHGCDKQLAEDIVAGKKEMEPSNNIYDWLGPGFYFWENNYQRALLWAEEKAEKSELIKEPGVLGAVIDLGYCLDLMDSECLTDLKMAYDVLVESCEKEKIPLPKNENIGKSTDKLLRKLDCAVIQVAHKLSFDSDGKQYDSVRGLFTEGGQLYPGSGFASKSHVQICVCNPNCIKGFFLPRKVNKFFPVP